MGLDRFTAAFLALLNKKHARGRALAGRPGAIIDTSLLSADESARLKAQGVSTAADALNGQAFDDLTDVENVDFIYVL